jgi:hypothetical protein
MELADANEKFFRPEARPTTEFLPADNKHRELIGS